MVATTAHHFAQSGCKKREWERGDQDGVNVMVDHNLVSNPKSCFGSRDDKTIKGPYEAGSRHGYEGSSGRGVNGEVHIGSSRNNGVIRVAGGHDRTEGRNVRIQPLGDFNVGRCGYNKCSGEKLIYYTVGSLLPAASLGNKMKDPQKRMKQIGCETYGFVGWSGWHLWIGQDEKWEKVTSISNKKMRVSVGWMSDGRLMHRKSGGYEPSVGILPTARSGSGEGLSGPTMIVLAKLNPSYPATTDVVLINTTAEGAFANSPSPLLSTSISSPWQSNNITDPIHCGHLTKAISALLEFYTNVCVLVHGVTQKVFALAGENVDAMHVIAAKVAVKGLVMPMLIGVNPPERLAKQRVITNITFHETPREIWFISYPELVLKVLHRVHSKIQIKLSIVVPTLSHPNYRIVTDHSITKRKQ
ncbi:uncharacterized protein EDB91DRAFT_1085861 [Suillus paluster]|uniref:uncharacterized protein n=1 Tax=Suillus paluster TaxID=48578 RepID=UPI001B884630|nr:uncharacterized protein EDB91DRAFT_1085861 [Suillus paluster]KAG1729080.1 hypothetical protein EDB91DRAFT_1085861 [Suillus paluster]